MVSKGHEGKRGQMQMRKCIVVLVLLVAVPTAVWAQEFSNAELYRMIKKLESKFDKAMAQTNQALAAAERAKAEAAIAMEEADRAKEEVARAKEETARVKAELARVKATFAPSAALAAPSVREGETVPGWQASVEMVHMRPSRDNLDYVIVDEAQTGPDQVQGNYKAVDPDYNIGTRLGLNYNSDTGAGLRLQYMVLKTEDKDHVTDNNGSYDLWGTWLHPNAIIDDNDVTSATMKYDFDMGVLDLSAHKMFNVGSHWSLGVEAGLRYAELDQDIAIHYLEDVSRAVGVYYKNEFTGIGPRVGVDADWRIGKGFNLFGSLAGSLLVGDFDLSLQELDLQVAATTYTTRVDVDRSDDNRPVPVVEMRAGIGYAYALKNGMHIGAKAGYELQQWFNMATNQRYTDDVDSQLMNTDTTDLLLDGFFLEGFVNY